MDDLKTRQAELEYECVMLGQKRYEETRVERGESETLPGQEQTKRALGALAKAIEEFVETAAAGAGRQHTALRYLIHILPEQAAYLTVRHAIDAAAANQKINTAAVALGAAVEDHVNLVNMKDEAPGLYRKVMEQVKTATTARHRNSVLRHVLKKYKLEKLEWSETDKLLLGTKLIELFDETCGLVTSRRDTEGRHNTPMKLVFTAEAQDWFTKAHAQASQWAPVHLPMLVPPRDWTTPYEGGYLTRALRRATMIQSHLPGAAGRIADRRESMGTVYTAVNTIQRTPWRINKSLLEIMREARAGGERYQSLFVEADAPLPVRPADVPEEGHLTAEQREVMSVWKREASEVYAANARLSSKRISVAQKFFVAEKFVDESAIYFPHYLDFRGRLYPYARYLNPQSDDMGRALLQFAEGKALGERGLFWLKVHVANLFGIDKVSYADRVQWVNEHLEELMDAALNPLDGQMLWTEADSPWCALAACMELTGAVTTQAMGSLEDFISFLPIAMDGSCSGLQHYSAMLRDPVGGAAVNLVPQVKPGDIYTAVAKRAQVLSDGSTNGTFASAWRGRVVRKIAKQPTMTMCYSATVYGMQGQIARAVHSLGGGDYIDGQDVRPACIYMAQIIWDAIGDVVVAARQAMDFLKGCADVTNEAGLAVCWTAPSGFLVEQGYREYIGKRIELHYKGHRIRLSLAVDGVNLDSKKQKAGIAPNFVHSLDSAHLMATVLLGYSEGLKHWACIHDSFGVHAADVDLLHTCIREAFVEQYTPHVLAQFREEIASQLPEELAQKLPAVPPQGTLDLAAVRESAYFFA